VGLAMLGRSLKNMIPQRLLIAFILFNTLISVGCNESTSTTQETKKNEEAILRINHKPTYGYGQGSFQIVLNNDLKGSESFSGDSDSSVSVSFCYVGKVDLSAPYQQGKSALKGHVIAVRYAEYDESKKKEIKELIEYIVYNGQEESQIDIGEVIVKISPKPIKAANKSQ
jgi:hypothetical protein